MRDLAELRRVPRPSQLDHWLHLRLRGGRWRQLLLLFGRLVLRFSFIEGERYFAVLLDFSFDIVLVTYRMEGFVLALLF